MMRAVKTILADIAEIESTLQQFQYLRDTEYAQCIDVILRGLYKELFETPTGRGTV